MPVASAERVKAMRSRRVSQPADPDRVALQLWLYPLTVERQYRRDLSVLVKTINDAVRAQLFPELPALVRQADQELRADSYSDSVETLVDTLKISLDPTFNDNRLRTLAMDIGQKSSEWNNEQWQKTLRAVLGVDLFKAEPWLVPLMEGWVKDNVALIKSIRDDSVRKVEGMTVRGLTSGQRHEAIKKEIVKEFGVTKRRAELIARDQVSKLNGNLTHHRQTDLGIDEYIWRTSMDERVRPSHRFNNFQRFKWSDPPPGTGHPGDDIQCRCTAEPVFTKVLRDSGIKTSIMPPRRVPRVAFPSP